MTWVLISLGTIVVLAAFLHYRYGADGKARRAGLPLPGRTPEGTDVAVSESKAYAEIHRNQANTPLF